MKSKKPLIIGITIVIVIAGTVAFLRKPTPTPDLSAETRAVAVTVRAVGASRTASVDLSFPGTVSSDGRATISAKSDGTIVASNVQLGSRVGIGTVLARIDDTTGSVVSDSGFRSADIRSAELAVERARLTYAEARRDDGNTDTHDSELAKDLAKRNLEAAESDLSALLDLHTVKSPIVGTVTAAPVSRGTTVTAGQALFTVDGGAKEQTVRFHVSESERAVLDAGLPVSIERTPGDPKPATGTLRSISPTADPDSRRFLAEAVVAGKDTLSPGTSVSVRLSSNLRPSESGTVFIPLSALVIGSDESSIFTESDGTASRISVTLVRIEGETAEVSVDLSDDARIIIENAKRVKDGDTVEISEN